MDTTVFSYIFENIPDISIDEVYRYLGIKGEVSNEIKEDVLSCLSLLKKEISPKACYMKVPVKITEKTVDLGVFKAESEKLSMNLKGSTDAFLIAVTLGAGCDRLINRFSSISPIKALYFQAAGTALIEALCDFLCDNILPTDKNLKPRFSPGYGDLSLELQKDFLDILDTRRKIGLYLTEGGIMVPLKSVSAIVGITDEKTCKLSCKDCGKNCEFMRVEK